MLDNIYDGIQRPLPEMRALSGDCIARGIDVPALNREQEMGLCTCGEAR